MSPTTLETKFLNFYREFFLDNVSVLVAVSGGSDSVALLRLFCKFKTILKIKNLAAVHVNHGLRGAESDADEQFVREIALKLDVPFFVKRLSCPDPTGAGIELWARRERYTFFHSVLETADYDWLATGHTLDDQAETMVMRIFRGSGVRGLRGILPIREDKVFRPLLKCRKKELEEWLVSVSQPFRFDSSNEDTKFRRNEIRLKILPLLNEKSSRIADQLCSLGEQMTKLWDKLVPDIENWFQLFVKHDAKNLIFINKHGFADVHIAQEGLRSLFEKIGISYTKTHIENVIKNAGRTGRFLLPCHWMYCSDKDNLIIFKQDVTESFNCTLSVPGVSVFHDLNKSFHITAGLPDDFSSLSKELSTIVVDRDTFDESLVYRSVNEEDTFQPFGRRSSVNVLHFLSRQGISKPVRQNMGIVADRYNKVVWVPAVRVNEQCKITKNTQRIIKISMKTLSTDI